MENLDELYNQISGQSSKESINTEEEQKLDDLETSGESTDDTPIDSTEPADDSGDNVVEPEGTDTSKKETEPEGEDEDDLDFDLDDLDLDDEDVEVSESNVDITSIANALGDNSIKSIEDATNTISSLKAKVQELEESSKLSNIPDDLARAISVAQQGGDYKSLLGVTSVDYSKMDPVDLYEREVIEALKDESGNVDYDQVEEYLDSMSEVDKKMKGKEVQRKLIERQAIEASEFEKQAQARQEQADKALTEAVNSKKEIAGFKLKPEHKQSLISGIKSGNMMKEMFLGKDGQYDFNKISDSYFKIKYFDKIQKVYEGKIKNSTKKEMIDSVTNSDVNRPKGLTDATPSTKNPLDSYLESLMPNK